MLLQLLAALSVLCVLPIASYSQCSRSSYSNGCSIPFKLPFFFKNRFKPACDKHDICYNCAERFGLSKDYCDRKFNNDIKQVCSSSGKRFIYKTAERAFCQRVRKTYYNMVSLFGQSYYVNVSPSWCDQSWVSQCLR